MVLRCRPLPSSPHVLASQPSRRGAAYSRFYAFPASSYLVLPPCLFINVASVLLRGRRGEARRASKLRKYVRRLCYMPNAVRRVRMKRRR